MTDPTVTLAAGLAGRYALERELGRGGMAVVYLARDLKHDRPVALKVLLPELASTVGLDRFQREIQLAARLQHPHILTVHDSGETAGQLWFTMPYVEGESLRDRLSREGRLPVEEALRIIREAALALQYAHDEGVVHRDIKPENLLLSRDGSVLVADFGIARPVAAEGQLTKTGGSMGTPAYMSPEQASGKTADRRSDVYSLAAVLFEMLVGRPPYTGSTAAAIVAKWFTEPVPSARELRPEVPETLDLAIQRALTQSPADRVGSTLELARALQGATLEFTPSPGLPPVRPPAGVRRWRTGAALGLGLAIAISGAFAAWRYTHAPVDRAPTVLAVLPFENLGDSADAYFAEGVTDELRTRIAGLDGVQVIARGSSNQYRASTKPPQEIARELGAGYLLTATVQWDKSTAGRPSRIRVIPELVEIAPGRTPRAKWQQSFDAALTDVFAVQADIATKVADALGMVLGDSARRRLAVKPTDNLAAYDEFLKGDAAAQGMKADQPGLRRAIAFYERAVSLDSTFAQAWSQLSRARTSLYSNGVPDAALGEAARTAAQRARALAPGDPLVYLAAGDLHSSVNPVDIRRAQVEYAMGLRLAPGDVDLLSAAAINSTRLQSWGDVVSRLEHALRLDPSSFTVARRLATARLFLRQYPTADSAIDRAIALAPTNPQMALLKVMIAVGRGDLPGARAAVDAAARRIDPAALVAFVATYQDLYWVLDDAQQRQVLSLGPSAFDDDRGAWGLVRTELYHLRGDSARAAVYADSARLALQAQSRSAPNDAERHVILGVALAYLGRKTEAIREGRRGVALLPITQDAFAGPYLQLQLIRIYLLTGEPDQALDALEPLLRMPFYVSPGWLRLDPAFRPLANNPRFEALLARS